MFAILAVNLFGGKF